MTEYEKTWSCNTHGRNQKLIQNSGRKARKPGRPRNIWGHKIQSKRMWRRPVRPMYLFVVELSCITLQSTVTFTAAAMRTSDLAWIQLAYGHIQWLDTLNTPVNLSIARNGSYFLSSWDTVNFSIMIIFKKFDNLIHTLHIVVFSVTSHAAEEYLSCPPHPEAWEREQATCHCRCNCREISLFVPKWMDSPGLPLVTRRE